MVAEEGVGVDRRGDAAGAGGADAGADGVDGGGRQRVGLADVEGEVAATEPLVVGEARAGDVAQDFGGEGAQALLLRVAGGARRPR